VIQTRTLPGQWDRNAPTAAAKPARPAKPEFRQTDLGRIGLLWLNGVSGSCTRAIACARIAIGFSRRGCAASAVCKVSAAGEKIPAGNKKGSPAVVGIHFHIGEKKIPGSLRREDRPREGRSGNISWPLPGRGRRDGTRCFTEKTAEKPAPHLDDCAGSDPGSRAGKRLAGGSGHFVSLGNRPSTVVDPAPGHWDGTRCFIGKRPEKSALTPTLSHPKRTGEGGRMGRDAFDRVQGREFRGSQS
jgi:hypothetical protein